ncbi:asparagine synthase-related protein [Sphingomonas faeni]|uniref:asparagine synthase-related protein n=1 Tax=Sphingomonas faeni TaxID=185950 RepID=UPI00278B1D95|nr:asparagine synthase-related protein [Sphingomonas faeni]MDQ0839216.1 asparagine synthase (glutamine-hydrolyzing) [Sphingomonas faeni]
MTSTFAVLTLRRSEARERYSRLTAILLSMGLRQIGGSARHVVLVAPEAKCERFAAGTIVIGGLKGRHRRSSSTVDGGTGRAAERAARDLTGSAWGSYVALFDLDEDPAAMVDPSGAGTAYEIADDDLSLLCDHVTPSLVRLAGFDDTVDLDALWGCLFDPTTALQAKLLSAGQRLVPGRLHSLLGRRAPLTIWSPAMFPERRDDPEGRLRAALDVSLAGTGARRPLVQLSGGLDSSIVVGSLALLAPGTQAVTATSSAGDVEETQFARSAAAHAGVRLIEKPSPGYPDYRMFCDAPQIAHPYLHGLDDLFGLGVDEAAAKVGADLVVTGQGGDALFLNTASPVVAVDRRRSLGSRASWRSIVDDARRSRHTIWHHLLPAEMDRFRGARPPEYSMVPPWVAERTLSPRIQHSWIDDAAGLPPGKRLHVAMLANSQVYHSERPSPGPTPLYHPLLSQPMLEAALSLPAWVLASGPINRGLARRAFAARLPPDVARRGSKGAATTLYGRAAVANLAFLREHLIGGALAGAGLIDAQKLDVTLTTDHLFHGQHNHSLILLASCEAWLRAWRR